MGITNTVAKLKAYFDTWHSATEHSAESLVNKKALFNEIYPVGSIYMTVENINPAQKFGGKWNRIEGYFLLGAKDNHEGWKLNQTGGTDEVILTKEQMPSHNHGSVGLTGGLRSVAYQPNPHTYGIASLSGNNANDRKITKTASGGFGAQTFHINASHTHSSEGQGYAHDNMPPYLAVNIWKRIE